MRSNKPNPPFYRLSKRKMIILLSLMVAIQLFLLSFTFKDYQPSPRKSRTIKEFLEDGSFQNLAKDVLKNHKERTRIPVVTSCSSKYFERLKNLVGSIHYWEPDLQIKIYDIGLSSEQLKEAENWHNVEIRIFDFSKYSDHFKNLKNFAWKPVVMLDALNRDGKWILYQDAGQEFRRTIEEVEELISKEGYFYVAQDGWETKLMCCGRIGELTVNSLFSKLGVSKADYENKTMCAGGIQGYLLESEAVEKVLKPTVKCAMDASCIEPEGSNLGNHRFDQSVFSIYIAKNGFKCQTDAKYWANRGNARTRSYPIGITENETKKNHVIFFSRRGWGIEYDNNPPKTGLYKKYLKFKNQ